MTTGFWTTLALIEFGLIVFLTIGLRSQGALIDSALAQTNRAILNAFRYAELVTDWDWPLAEDHPLSDTPEFYEGD